MDSLIILVSHLCVQGYFESLRNEMRGKNIGITMLCPGPVFSGILKEAFTSKKGAVIAHTFLINEIGT